MTSGTTGYDVNIRAWDKAGNILTCGFRRFDSLPTDEEIETLRQDTLRWNQWAVFIHLKIIPRHD